MKKILFISIFMLCALLMVACDDTDYPFSLIVDRDQVSELRESISFELELKDDEDHLKNSEVKGEITKKDSSTVISTKDVSFGKETKTATVEFKSLTADTEYTVTFYVGYEGKKVELYKGNHKTSDRGTEEKPYEVRTADDFTNIVKKDPNGFYKIADDVEFIDFNGKSITPLFTSSKPFVGSFDGNGKTIKNFKLSSVDSATTEATHSSQSSQYYGLFGYIGEKGSVYNLTLDSFDVMIKRSSDSECHYGLLAGYCAGEVRDITVVNSKIDVKSEKTAKEKFNVGGLIGKLTSTAKLSNVSVKADVVVYSAMDATVGGVVANTAGAVIIETTKDNVVGFISNISKANYEGNITVTLNGSAAADSQTSIGGICGNNYSAIIEDSHSKGKISLTSDFTTVGSQGLTLGGVVGKNQNPNSKIAKSTSTMDFYVKTTDAPSKVADDSKNEQKYLQVNVGLVVGINKGIIVESSYTQPSATTYEIHVNNSEFVNATVGVVAVNNSSFVTIGKHVVTKNDVTFTKVLYKLEDNTMVEDSRTTFDTIVANTAE